MCLFLERKALSLTVSDKKSQNRFFQPNKVFYSDIHVDMAVMLRTAIQVAEVSPSKEVTQL